MKNKGNNNATALLPRYCTSCGYNLRGLDEPCKCPECGKWLHEREYVFPDVHTRVLPDPDEPSPWVGMWPLWIFLIAILGWMGFTAWRVAASVGWWAVAVALFDHFGRTALFVGAIAILFALVVRASNRGRKMIIKNGRLTFPSDSKSVDAHAITSITIDDAKLQCVLHFKRTQPRDPAREFTANRRCAMHVRCHAIALAGFASHDEIQAFAAYVRQQREQHADSTAQPQRKRNDPAPRYTSVEAGPLQSCASER